MGTVTEEFRKSLQSKPGVLAPKPFHGRPPMKHFTAPVTNGDAGAPKQGFGLSSSDLSRKLKPVSQKDNISTSSSSTEDDNVPEFLRAKLKSPFQKREEEQKRLKEKEAAAKVISHAIKPPVKPKKPPIMPKQNGQESCSPSDETDKFLSRDRATSVKDQRSFFEANDKMARDSSIPKKPPLKPKGTSLPRNAPPTKPEKPMREIPPKPQPTIPAAVVPQEDELYDDVGTPSLRCIDNHDINSFQTEDETYDDVSNHDNFPAPPAEISGNDNSFPAPPVEISGNEEITQEFYDDVVNHIPDTRTPDTVPEPQEGELYDDVAVPQPTAIVEDDFYDDVTTQDTNEPTSPVKLPKTFTDIPMQRFVVPLGLDRWLQSALLTHKARLKSFANTNFNPPVIHREVKPPERIRTESELEDLQTENDSTAGTDADATINRAKSEKDRKKEEKERKKRERDEKKKEKDEKKKKEKEYKQFGLNPEQPVVIVGSVSCCSDYTPKSKDKLDISYSIGDEISIIDYKKAPTGRMLVQNVTSGRLGYVLRKDFNMEEELPEPDPTRNRAVSLIATEDQDGELYEDIPGQQNVMTPPPIPETPRPNLKPDAVADDLYNDVAEPIEDNIYEQL